MSEVRGALRERGGELVLELAEQRVARPRPRPREIDGQVAVARVQRRDDQAVAAERLADRVLGDDVRAVPQQGVEAALVDRGVGADAVVMGGDDEEADAPRRQRLLGAEQHRELRALRVAQQQVDALEPLAAMSASTPTSTSRAPASACANHSE